MSDHEETQGVIKIKLDAEVPASLYSEGDEIKATVIIGPRPQDPPTDPDGD